jgi:hypothetical protein
MIAMDLACLLMDLTKYKLCPLRGPDRWYPAKLTLTEKLNQVFLYLMWISNFIYLMRYHDWDSDRGVSPQAPHKFLII